MVRGQVLSIRENAYIEAIRAIGASPQRIMLFHILPNVAASIIVLVTFQLPAVVLVESSLSYLGLGVQPPEPSWGNMLADARTVLTTAPWLTYLPAMFLTLVVMSCNFLGDRLRDLWDPRLRGAR